MVIQMDTRVYDEVSVLVDSNGEQKLVFKRALSTIGPDKEEPPKPRHQSRSW